MSKKPAFTMPKDRSEALQRFVDGDEAAAAVRLPSRMPAGGPGAKQTRLNVDLPPELHRRFKTACAAEGVKMAEVVTQLIQGWTADKH